MKALRTSIDNLKVRRRTKGREVIAWIEATCVYTAGPLIGDSVRLMGWQKRFILYLFSVDAFGKRIYRWCLLGVPKKQGKTELAAWLGLYFLLGDETERAPIIIMAASSDEQADLCYGAAKRCVELSPVLNSLVKTYSNVMRVPSRPGAELRRVAAAAGTNDGKNISVVIIDELHEWTGEKGRNVWTILTNGIGAREQPLILQITTAGVDVEGTLGGEQYLFGDKLVEEPELDPGFLFWWYKTPEGADYRDPEVWKAVSPSWGVCLPDPMTYLKDQLGKKRESEFRRYFCNEWVESEEIWLPYGTWDACEDKTVELDTELPLYVGIDGALKRDSFAIVAYQPQPVITDEGELEREFVVRQWIWANPYPPGHPLRDSWKMNLQEPMNILRDLRRDFPAPAIEDEEGFPIYGPVFMYDPFMLELLAQDLVDEGLNMVECPQTDSRMMPGSEACYTDIITGVLVHDGDPVMKRQVHGAVPKEKDRGWRLTKPRDSKRKIDAAIAMVMAAYAAHLTDPADDAPPTVW